MPWKYSAVFKVQIFRKNLKVLFHAILNTLLVLPLQYHQENFNTSIINDMVLWCLVNTQLCLKFKSFCKNLKVLSRAILNKLLVLPLQYHQENFNTSIIKNIVLWCLGNIQLCLKFRFLYKFKSIVLCDTKQTPGIATSVSPRKFQY